MMLKNSIFNKLKQIWANHKFVFKILISICVLYIVFNNLDLTNIILSAKGANLYYLVPCLFILLIIVIFMTLKWDIFLRKYEKINLIELIKIYWASDFVNLFGVGAIGSETYKMFSFRERKKALFASLIDRTYSFVWYIFIGGSIFVAYLLTNNENIITIIIGILFFLCIVFIYIIMERWIKKELSYTIRNELFNKIIFESQKTKREMLMHSFYCLIILLLQVAIYSLIFTSVGLNVKVIQLFIFIPILTIALVLPISFQGFGIREFFFIEFAKWNMIAPEKTLIASFLLYFIGLIYRVIGIGPFLLLKK